MQASEMTLEQHVKHIDIPEQLRDVLLRIVKECKPAPVAAARPLTRPSAESIRKAIG